MVVGAFPIAKLSVLLVKQISKPIANACKNRAKSHPFFRKYVCMPPAQFYNWCEVKAKMWILNLGKPVNIPVLSEDMAIELGANLLGETVIFVIGAVLLVIEYQRQVKKEAAKEVVRLAEAKRITDAIQELFYTVQLHETQLREIEKRLPIKPHQPPSFEPPEPRKLDPFPEAPVGPESKPALHEPMKMEYHHYNGDQPYPNSGLILRSLNYIQMDLMNNNNTSKQPEKNTKYYRRESETTTYRVGIVTLALDDLEKQFQSLF